MTDFPYCRSNSSLLCDCRMAYLVVELSFVNNSIAVEGLIDSGCSVTLVNAELAEPLGIDVSTCVETKIGVVGGEVKGFMTEINFEVQGVFEKYSGPVIFVEDLFVSVLLGQNNFFDKFDIHFQKSSYKFSIEPAEK